MTYQFEDPARRFTAADAPKLHCPYCLKGSLIWNADKLNVSETKESERQHKLRDFEPDWVEEIFSGFVLCTNKVCGEKVAVSGKSCPVPEYDILDGEPNPVWERRFEPRIFVPTVRLFNHEEIEFTDVHDALERVFALYWMDEGACATAIGIAVESLLTDQGVKRFENVKHKRRAIWLDRRLKIYEKKNPEIVEKLMTIKWLRNSGGHGGEVDEDDINHALRLLNYIILKLYEDPDLKITESVKHLKSRHKK